MCEEQSLQPCAPGVLPSTCCGVTSPTKAVTLRRAEDITSSNTVSGDQHLVCHYNETKVRIRSVTRPEETQYKPVFHVPLLQDSTSILKLEAQITSLYCHNSQLTGYETGNEVT